MANEEDINYNVGATTSDATSAFKQFSTALDETAASVKTLNVSLTDVSSSYKYSLGASEGAMSGVMRLTRAVNEQTASMAVNQAAWDRYLRDVNASLTAEAKHQFDQVTNSLERQAVASTAATATMLTNLRAYQKEEETAEAARQKFASRVAPQTNVAAYRSEQSAIVAATLANLQAYQKAEETNDIARQKFISQVAPQSKVDYKEITAARAAAAPEALLIPPVPAGANVWATYASDSEMAFGRGAAAAKTMRVAVEETTAASTTLGGWFRNLITLFDEFMRGQRGAEAATLGRIVKGGGGAGLLAGVAGFAAIEGINKLTSSMSELAEKTETSAAAAGMSVEKFSMLQRTMQIVDGDAGKATRTLAFLGRQIQEALADPVGKAAEEFSKFGITQQQLADGSQDTEAFLDLLRQRFQALPPDLQRTAIASMAAGRGFQELLPHLKLTADKLAEVKSKVPLTSIIDQSAVDKLTPAGESVRALGEAFSGLGLAIAESATSTRFNDWLRGIVTTLTDGVTAIDSFINAIDRLSESQQRTKNQVIGGVAGAVAGSLAGPLGAAAGAVAGAYGGGRLPISPGPTQSEPNPGEAYAPLPTRAQRAQQYFQSQGLSDVQASGMVGVLQQESGPELNPQAKTGNHIGIAQWSPERAQALGVTLQSSFDEQLAAIIRELKTTETKAYTKILSATTTEQAVAGMKSYERPDVDYSQKANRSAAALSRIPPAQLPSGYDFETDVLTAPKSGATALDAEFQRNLKFIEDKKKLLDASSAQEIALADKDQNAIDAIKQRGIRDTQAVLAEELALRNTYAARILQTTDSDAKKAEIAAKVRDSTGMDTKLIQAGTSEIETQNTIRRQQIQDTISGLEAEKLKAGTFQEQYNIELKIADLKAQLNRDAAGELDRARALNALEKEQFNAAMKGASDQLSIGEKMVEAQTALMTARTKARPGEQSRTTPEQTIVTEMGLYEQLAERVEKSYSDIAAAAKAGSQEQIDAQMKVIDVAQNNYTKQAQLYEKLSADLKREADKSAAPFVSAFDEIGNAIEKIPQELVTRTANVRKIGLDLISSLTGDITKGLAGIASQFIAKQLGGAVGQGLGSFLGDKLGSLLNLGTSATGEASLTTAGGLLTTSAGELSAAAAALTSAAAASGAAGVAGGAAGVAGGDVGFAALSSAIFGFKMGGIVPSAAGGFLVPSNATGGGGTLSILHPKEMVLPAPLSQGIQAALGQGGLRGGGNNTANLTYAPTINGTSNAFATRAQAEALFRQHGEVMIGQARNLIRNGFRP